MVKKIAAFWDAAILVVLIDSAASQARRATINRGKKRREDGVYVFVNEYFEPLFNKE